MTAVLVLHGPNLNLLGERQPEIYGSMRLEEINQLLVEAGHTWGLEVRAQQSNSEGALIDALHAAREWASGVIINPGGYTHTSIALRDAVDAIDLPVIEVHLSNVEGREEFRSRSYLGAVCSGKIFGFGWRSYLLALYGLSLMLEGEGARE